VRHGYPSAVGGGPRTDPSLHVALPPLERWATTTAAELGFAQVEHVVELTGLCAGCQSATARG